MPGCRRVRVQKAAHCNDRQAGECQCVSLYRISWRSVKRMNCSDLAIFKMAAVRHLEIVVCLHETTREEYLVAFTVA